MNRKDLIYKVLSKIDSTDENLMTIAILETDDLESLYYELYKIL